MPPHRTVRTSVKPSIGSMPLPRPKFTPTNPEVLRLTEAMTKYYILIETCSQCVRVLPNRSQLYKEAREQWKHRPEFYRPSSKDEAARARFFAAVDKVCQSESRDPENCYLIIFACSVAIQLVLAEDLMKLRERDRNYVMVESQRVTEAQIIPNMGSASTSALAPTQATPNSTLYPASPSFPETQPFGDLVGKQISYQDPKNGKTRECIVMDHIKSFLRGTCYLITDSSDGWKEEVSEDKMQELLNKSS